MLALSEHFTRMETDREGLRLEMGRVTEENEWLREELSETQKRMIEAEAELGTSNELPSRKLKTILNKTYH